MNFRCLTALAFVVCLPLAGGYTVTPTGQAAGTMSIGEPIQIQAPLGLPPVHVSADNPTTAESISLGRSLDDDKNFSQERKDLVAFLECPAGEIPPGVGALV